MSGKHERAPYENAYTLLKRHVYLNNFITVALFNITNTVTVKYARYNSSLMGKSDNNFNYIVSNYEGSIIKGCGSEQQRRVSKSLVERRMKLLAFDDNNSICLSSVTHTMRFYRVTPRF